MYLPNRDIEMTASNIRLYLMRYRVAGGLMVLILLLLLSFPLLLVSVMVIIAE